MTTDITLSDHGSVDVNEALHLVAAGTATLVADGLEVVTPSVRIEIPSAVLLGLGRRAATNRSGKAVIGGTRRGGGITATVRGWGQK